MLPDPELTFIHPFMINMFKKLSKQLNALNLEILSNPLLIKDLLLVNNNWIESCLMLNMEKLMELNCLLEVKDMEQKDFSLSQPSSEVLLTI